jgi:hypothetical protein
MLEDRNFSKIRIYLDLLQYTPMERKLAQDPTKKKQGKNLNRDIDKERQWHLDVLLSRSNLYEL